MQTATKAGIVVVVLILLAVGAYSAVVLNSGAPSKSTSSSTASTTTTPSTTTTTTTTSVAMPSVINIGYYANINHAPAILGISSGSFQSALGPSTTIDTHLFTSGGPEMTALLAGQLDMAYVGPDPAVNAWIQSNGTGLEIIAGVSSGGAVFVVQNDSGITSVADLGGKTFAAPGAGNTQDIALRYYLIQNGYQTTTNGGNVTIVDTTNSNIVTLFAEGKIDGAWVPEPYGEVLIQQYGGKLFLDERSLWPGGNFSTTELVVRTAFLQQYPTAVRDIVSADVNETVWINDHMTLAENDLNSSLVALTGEGYSASILNASLSRLTFTFDPLESSVQVQAEHAYAVGDLTENPTNISAIFNLSILNSVLTQDGLPTVQS